MIYVTIAEISNESKAVFSALFVYLLMLGGANRCLSQRWEQTHPKREDGSRDELNPYDGPCEKLLVIGLWLWLGLGFFAMIFL